MYRQEILMKYLLMGYLSEGYACRSRTSKKIKPLHVHNKWQYFFMDASITDFARGGPKPEEAP